MNAQQFKRWLAKQGCTFESKKGGSGHLIVRLGRPEVGSPDARRQQAAGHGPDERNQEAAGVEVMFGYWIDLTPDDNGTLLVICQQLPIVASFGEDRDDALHHAAGAIEEALASMIDDGEEIPRPDPSTGTAFVALPLLTALKINLYWALRSAGITRAELARRLGWNRESVDRLFRLDHRSRLEQLEAAFAELGKQIDIEVQEAA